MAEYSSMEHFEQLPFFIYQRALNVIYTMICKHNIEKRYTLFQKLHDDKYPEISISYLKEENLLDPTSTSFSLSLTRDMLSLLLEGSDQIPDFAKKLALHGAVDFFTDIILSFSQINNSQSIYVSKQLIGILHNIARRKESTGLVSFDGLIRVLKDVTLPNVRDSLVQKMLLSLIVAESDIVVTTSDEIKTAIDYIKQASVDSRRKHGGFHISELLQALPKFAKHPEARLEIISLLDTLKDVLADNDQEQLQHVMDLLKEMTVDKVASEQIIQNEGLTDSLSKLDSSEDISEHVTSIFWNAGQRAGRFPNNAERFVSLDFPKEFTVKDEPIGRGAFGSVHLVIDTNKPDENRFVAKRINFTKEMEVCKKEAEILLKTKHKRIVQFHGYMRTTDTFFIFLEYIKNGTLALFISRNGNLNETLTRDFTFQILEGVEYLHQKGILHRDIKGNNILMVDDMNIKLTDFGISEYIDEEGVATEIGTVRYMAPEVIYTDGGKIINYTSRADIWSVGCTVIEMLTGKPPNSSVPTPLAILRNANSEPLHYQLPPSSSVYLQEFLDTVLHREAKQRPTADWLLKNDPFIVGFHSRDGDQGPSIKKRRLK